MRYNPKIHSDEVLDWMVLEIYDTTFSRIYRDSNKIWDSEWSFQEQPKGKIPLGCKVIKELLKKGHLVKCGKATTSVRGFYTYHIFYK